MGFYLTAQPSDRVSGAARSEIHLERSRTRYRSPTKGVRAVDLSRSRAVQDSSPLQPQLSGVVRHTDEGSWRGTGVGRRAGGDHSGWAPTFSYNTTTVKAPVHTIPPAHHSRVATCVSIDDADLDQKQVQYFGDAKHFALIRGACRSCHRSREK